MSGNSITMHGNLVADPVQRSTASGHTVTRFRIASNMRRFDSNRNEWVDSDPVFMSVSCWRKLAVSVMNSLRKGDSVVVHGRLTQREYDDNNGVHRQAYEIDAQSVGPDLTRFWVQVQRPQRDAEPAAQESSPAVDPYSAPPQQSAEADPDRNPWTEERPAETAA